MQWSKLKTRLKALICSELRDRVDFHMTRFREAHDQKGRGWVTIDGTEVLDCSFYRWNNAIWKEQRRLLEKTPVRPGSKEYLEIHQTATDAAEANQIYGDRFFRYSLLEYLDLPIQDALASENPIIRAFAIIDRRLGKRSFERLHLATDEHPLVQAFYELRSGVFGTGAVVQN